MKKYLLSFALIALAVYGLAQPLSGTYTIDAGSPTSGTNFQTFSAAFSALTSNGVSGPVTMNVAEGTYTEQVYLGSGSSISGTSSTNTVTIQSDPSNTNMPVWQYSSYPVYWYFANLSYLTIEGLNIKTTGSSRVLYLYYGNYDNVNWVDNKLDGYDIATSSNSYAVIYSYYGTRDNCHFEGNEINEGSIGLYYYYGNSTDFYFENNTVQGAAYYGIYHYASTSSSYYSKLHINGNDVDVEGYTTTYGIYSRYSRAGSEFIGNDIYVTSTNSSSTIYGLYYYYGNYAAGSTRATVANNMIITGDGSATGTHYSLYTYYPKSTDIIHNTIDVRSTSTNARAHYLYMGSSSTTYGNNTVYNNIYTASNSNPYTVYIYHPYNWDGGGNNLCWNGDGMKSYFYTGFPSNTTVSYDLTSFNSNSNSTGNFSEAPGYVGPNDLHIFNVNLDGAGYNVGLTYDIDGETRVASIPDIGADEFVVPPNDAKGYAVISPINPMCNTSNDITVAIQNTGLNNLTSATIEWEYNNTPQTSVSWSGNLPSGGVDTVTVATSFTVADGDFFKIWTEMPNNVIDPMPGDDTVSTTALFGLSGDYTIGASAGSDYADFNEAADDLHARGVCGPVIFAAEDGVYDEQVTIGDVYGVSSVNTVKFTSQATNTEMAHLTHESTGFGNNDNGTVIFDGAKYVSFDSLHISSSNTSYGRVISFLFAENSGVNNCLLVGDSNTTTTSDYMAVVMNENGTGVDSCFVTNNEISGGSYATYWYGGGSTTMEYGNVIENNVATEYYYSGIFSYYQSGININNNYLEDRGQYTTSYGLYRYYNDYSNSNGNHIVVNNTGTNYGLRLYYNDADISNPGSARNNFVVITSGTGTKYGVQMYYSSYQHIYNNNINIVEGSSSSYGMYMYLTSPTSYAGCEVIGNNSVVRGQGQTALYYYNADYQVSDYNNFYYPNGSLGYAGATYPDLASYQAGTNNDANALSVDPLYVSETDLHVCQAQLRDASTTSAGVAMDFDGSTRNGTPDIGADEFMPGGPLDLGLDTTICEATYELSINDPVSSIFWSANAQSSNANSYLLDAGNQPETFNVSVVITTESCGLAFGSGEVILVPPVNFDSAASHLCPEENLTITAAGGPTAVYSWTPLNATTKSVTVEEPGIFIATKDEMGCQSIDTITVTTSEAPALEDMEVCDANIPYAADASVNGGLTYNWSGGASTSTAVNDLSDAGTYTISITDQYGCDYEHTFDLDVIEVPAPSIAIQTNTGNAFTFVGSSNTNVGSNATYDWTFGPNNVTDTGMVVTHIFPWSQEPSNYQVELVIENNCSAASTTTEVSTTVGVNDQSDNNGVKVFPNPITDHAQLKFVGSHSDINIDVLDVTGRVVLSRFESSSNNVSLNVSGLASGSYSIRVTTDQAPMTVIPVIVR